jgi:hypothetical protein
MKFEFHHLSSYPEPRGERRSDFLMMEMMSNSEMTTNDSRKRHFALALLMIEITHRLADVGFQECDI